MKYTFTYYNQDTKEPCGTHEIHLSKFDPLEAAKLSFPLGVKDEFMGSVYYNLRDERGNTYNWTTEKWDAAPLHSTYVVKMKILSSGKIVELGTPHELDNDKTAIGTFHIFVDKYWKSPLDTKEAIFYLVKDGNEIIATLPTQTQIKP